MKIISWRRLFTFLFALLLLFAIICFALTKDNSEVKDVQTYEIKSGETLWSIASKYKPETMSIQEYIYNLQAYNNIGCLIYPKQEIKVLVY